MSQDNDRSKSRNDEKQLSQPESKEQINPGEDSMRSEETNTKERIDPKPTPDTRKGETQKVKDDEGKDNDEDVD